MELSQYGQERANRMTQILSKIMPDNMPSDEEWAQYLTDIEETWLGLAEVQANEPHTVLLFAALCIETNKLIAERLAENLEFPEDHWENLSELYQGFILPSTS